MESIESFRCTFVTVFISAPGLPRNLQSTWQNSSSVLLQWEVPEERNGDLDQYQLQYRRSYVDEGK